MKEEGWAREAVRGDYERCPENIDFLPRSLVKFTVLPFPHSVGLMLERADRYSDFDSVDPAHQDIRRPGNSSVPLHKQRVMVTPTFLLLMVCMVYPLQTTTKLF